MIGTKGRIELEDPFWTPHSIKVYDTKQNLVETFEFPCNPKTIVDYNFRNSSNLHFQVLYRQQIFITNQKYFPGGKVMG